MEQQTYDLKVGFGRTDITPKAPTPLANYGDPEKRYSQGCLDGLYALTTALTDAQGNTLLLVVTDLSWADMDMNEAVRKAVKEKYGIPDNNVLVGGTHNHSAPAWNGTSAASVAYMEYWLEATLASIDEAIADRKPAKLYIGTSETKNLTFVKRYWQEDGLLRGDNHLLSDSPIVRHEKEADGQIQLVRIERQGGKDVLLVNFQSHANRLGWEQRYMTSSEWVGRMRARVEQKMDCCCMYFQGAAANLNPNSKFKEENIVDTWDGHGEVVGDAVVAACQKADTFRPIRAGVISTAHRTFTGDIDKSEAHKVEDARRILDIYEETLDERACDLLCRQVGIETTRHAYGILGRYNEEEDTKTMELYAAAVGELSLVTFPVEVFDTTGVQIKAATPYPMTLLMGYACGQELYVPDADGFAHGGYEVHTCLYAPGTAEKMVDCYLQMLKQLHSEK